MPTFGEVGLRGTGITATVAIIRPDLHYVQQTRTKVVATTIEQTQPTALPARRFDNRRSAKLDALIISLDDAPPRLRARMLRLHKRWLERQVPAFHAGRAR